MEMFWCFVFSLVLLTQGLYSDNNTVRIQLYKKIFRANPVRYRKFCLPTGYNPSFQHAQYPPLTRIDLDSWHRRIPSDCFSFMDRLRH